MWWRIFIPSWTFFDKPSLEPELWILTEVGWERVALPLRKGFLSLFFNPIGNLNHARGGLLERLIVEASSSASPRDLVSYSLIQDLAQAEAKARQRTLAGFKVCIRGEDALVSA